MGNLSQVYAVDICIDCDKEITFEKIMGRENNEA